MPDITVTPRVLTRIDPIARMNFTVDWGQGVMGFSEVILPASKAEVLTYRAGDDKSGGMRTFPGRISYGPAILRRATAPTNELLAWWKTVQDGRPERRDVTITIQDAMRQNVKQYKLIGAWPSRYQPGPLTAKGDDIVMEELELVVERFEYSP